MPESTAAHREAEHLLSEAELAVTNGDLVRARELYLRAAERESVSFGAVPRLRSKTRGILAISAVSLFRSAYAFAEAKSHALRYLAAGDLPRFAEEQLLDLLIDVRWQEAARAAGRDLPRDAFVVSLRGRIVRSGGLVPAETVIQKLQEFKHYTIRVGEWVTKQPFRPRGRAAREVEDNFVPLVSPARAGSYEFDLRVETPLQMPLLVEGVSPTPDSVTNAFITILEAITLEDGDIDTYVPEENYRDIFLKLVRNLVPNGKDLEEIEIAKRGGLRSTVLRPEQRPRIRRRIAALKPPERERELVRYGILRALHLDEGWVLLVEDGEEKKCFIEPDKLFDDVVGPLVNQRVGVSGHWRHNAFYATDLFEAEGEEG